MFYEADKIVNSKRIVLSGGNLTTGRFWRGGMLLP
jgi:hypothetical protein